MLNKIHRSKEDVWWTESCLRLRDFTCTKAGDHDWWREHDLDRGHLDETQKAYFENEAVWLCVRCEDVGGRNGRKLAHMAEDEKQLIYQIMAAHSHKSARKLPSTAFDGLRDVVNIVRGCKVVLTRNVAYLYGLANGTRGKVVGVIYGPGEIGDFPEPIVVAVPEYCGPAFYDWGADMGTAATHDQRERRDEDDAHSVLNRGWVRADGGQGARPDHT